MGVYKKLLSYVPKLKFLAWIGILCSAISAILVVLSYYFIYDFLVKLIVKQDSSLALDLAFVIVGVLFASSLVYLFSLFLTHILAFKLETTLRKRGIDGLMNSSFKFYDLNSSGRVRKLIDDNAALTHSVIAHLIPDNIGAMMLPLMVIALSFLISIKLAIALLIILGLGLFEFSRMMGEKDFFKIYQEALDEMNSQMVEYVRVIQVIKIFNSGLNAFKTLKLSIQRYSKFAKEYSKSTRGTYVRFQLYFYLVPVIVIALLISFTNLNNPRELSVQLLMFFFFSGVILSGLMKIMYLGMYSMQGHIAVDNLESIYSQMKEDCLDFKYDEVFDNYDIEFQDVSFSYNEDLVLDKLSFKLKESRSYAFIGDSGGGKSTIAKLLSGFYNINSGVIKIGGKNILSYSKEAISKNIAFVFQDTKLFKKSIFDNVQIGNPKASREEVLKALSLAGCDSFINRLPFGNSTLIGSKGIFLSGGEKARIAIARAILKDAKIIIMDEASAAIDPDNEYEMQKAFKNLMKDKTVIMIAHRLSSIRAVDEILVVEKGKIIERGSDEELMAENKRYKHFQDLYAKANDWRLVDEKNN